MSNPLRDRVEEFLEQRFPSTQTNQEIARELGAPMPSIRRATKELQRRDRIVLAAEGYGSMPALYAAKQGIAAQAQQ